jgi:glycosyltransferase involved in cell wall biosynthesis
MCPNIQRKVKLAIIIPAFNCHDTIAKTLASLQAIEYGWQHVVEIVICDDASTDDTVAVIKAANFNRCPLKLLYHGRNLGEGQCCATMTGSLWPDVSWFLILHADDLAEKNFLERNIEIVRRCCSRVASVSSNYWVFGRGTVLKLAHDPPKDVIVWRGGKPNELMHTISVGTWWHISGALVNRAVWEKLGGRDPTLPQLGDWDLMLRWQHNNYIVGHSLIPTTRYRIAAGSVSSRSYLEFGDLHERTLIILRYPALFTRKLRISAAAKLAVQASRRILRLLLAGQMGYALRGAARSISYVIKLTFTGLPHVVVL